MYQGWLIAATYLIIESCSLRKGPLQPWLAQGTRVTWQNLTWHSFLLSTPLGGICICFP